MMNTNSEYSPYESGIEPEGEDSLNDPFKPEDISIESKVVSMDSCLRRLQQGTIKLNPDFQRNEVWTMDKKSQLIESLMLKIPLPMFYVAADEKNDYTVVDGLQRLSTIRSFVLGDEYLNSESRENSSNLKGDGFRLQELEFWEMFNTKNFNELPENIKNRILETEFRFTVINPGTPEEVKRNIFKRINTGGLPLSSQEIRNALYIGNSTSLLNRLVEFDEFTEATGYSIKSLRMEDKELVLRFLAFQIRDYTTYQKSISADEFLSNTMIILNAFPEFKNRDFLKLVEKDAVKKNDIKIFSLDYIEDRFRLGMDRSFQIFGRHTFRKSHGENNRSPINKSLFETWGVIMSDLSYEEFNQLLVNQEQFLIEYSSIIDTVDMQIAISRDSMKHLSVKYRFETFKNLINNYIK